MPRFLKNKNMRNSIWVIIMFLLELYIYLTLSAEVALRPQCWQLLGNAFLTWFHFSKHNFKMQNCYSSNRIPRENMHDQDERLTKKHIETLGFVKEIAEENKLLKQKIEEYEVLWVVMYKTMLLLIIYDEKHFQLINSYQSVLLQLLSNYQKIVWFNLYTQTKECGAVRPERPFLLRHFALRCFTPCGDNHLLTVNQYQLLKGT